MFRPASVVVMIGVLASTVWSQPKTQPVYATPGDVINAAQKADRAGDADAYLACFTVDGQRQMAGMLISVLQMSPPPTGPATQPADQKMLDLVKKYNLFPPRLANETDDQYTDRVLASIADPHAFLLEAGMQNEGAAASPPSVLENVHIDSGGNTAQGKLTRHDTDADGSSSTMLQDVKFKKVDGSWKIDQAVAF